LSTLAGLLAARAAHDVARCATRPYTSCRAYLHARRRGGGARGGGQLLAGRGPQRLCHAPLGGLADGRAAVGAGVDAERV